MAFSAIWPFFKPQNFFQPIIADNLLYGLMKEWVIIYSLSDQGLPPLNVFDTCPIHLL